MTKQEIQIIAKVVQKIVQTEIAKSHKKLISEISTLKKSGMTLNESATNTYAAPINNVKSSSPSLDLIREMVGNSVIPGSFDDYDDILPSNDPSDPTNMFMKDYSKTLQRMEDAVKPFRDSL